MSEDTPKLELVAPNVERDAPLSLEWVNGAASRDTLLKMGNTPDSIVTTTLEDEKQRTRDFIESDTQRTWMIKTGEKIVGATWVDLEPSEYLPAPAVHIMIGDPSARGKGVGHETIQAVLNLLNEKGQETLYSRHLATNEGATKLLAGLGFSPIGEQYEDKDGLVWQNVEVNVPNQQLRKSIMDQIDKFGADSLAVNDLTLEDLDGLGWSGGTSHVEHVGEALKRDDIDYLAVRAPNGQAIAKGAIDYSAHEGAGTLTQLATMPELRGLGIGTRLISQLEEKIRQHGLHTAILGVEIDNPDAKRLYDRLGYIEYDQTQESWEEKDEHGQPYTYVADVILMKKELA